MRTHYLDCWNEASSVFILEELGVKLGVSDDHSKTQAHEEVKADFFREHCSETAVVICGPAVLDVRDSGDCWMRCYIDATESLTVPANVFRRLSNTSAQNYTPLFRYMLAKDENVYDGVHTTRSLVCDLCKQFFEAGWVTGAYLAFDVLALL